MDKIDRVLSDDTLRERAFDRITKNIVCNKRSGCWEYHGSKNSHGYGQIGVARGLCHIRIHRLMYQYFKGDLTSPEDYVLHSCDNPSCCNPMHLRKGSAKENTKDLMERGPYSPPPIHKGEDHPMKRTGLSHRVQGSRNGNSRYKEEDAIVAYLWDRGVSEYINTTGNNKSFYYSVRHKTTWKSVTDKLDKA